MENPSTDVGSQAKGNFTIARILNKAECGVPANLEAQTEATNPNVESPYSALHCGISSLVPRLQASPALRRPGTVSLPSMLSRQFMHSHLSRTIRRWLWTPFIQCGHENCVFWLLGSDCIISQAGMFYSWFSCFSLLQALLSVCVRNSFLNLGSYLLNFYSLLWGASK